MKSGPELDALVAEKVLGWSEVERGYGYPPGRAAVNGKWPIPTSSQHIAAAWEVWEEMKEKSSHHGVAFPTREPWISFCREFQAWDSDGVNLTFWELNPLSICLAALKVVGVEVEEREEERFFDEQDEEAARIPVP